MKDLFTVVIVDYFTFQRTEESFNNEDSAIRYTVDQIVKAGDGGVLSRDELCSTLKAKMAFVGGKHQYWIETVELPE